MVCFEVPRSTRDRRNWLTPFSTTVLLDLAVILFHFLSTPRQTEILMILSPALLLCGEKKIISLSPWDDASDKHSLIDPVRGAYTPAWSKCRNVRGWSARSLGRRRFPPYE